MRKEANMVGVARLAGMPLDAERSELSGRAETYTDEPLPNEVRAQATS